MLKFISESIIVLCALVKKEKKKELVSGDISVLSSSRYVLSIKLERNFNVGKESVVMRIINSVTNTAIK